MQEVIKIKKKLIKMTFAALFAALTCAATIVIQIPSGIGGYLNLGDMFVLVSGFVMGPVYGFCAAGIGSALADIPAYPVYAPATFIIKGLVAVIASVVFRALYKAFSKHVRLARLTAGIAGELFMVLGYFVYACFLYNQGFAAALTSIPGNLLQGLAGIVFSVLLMEVLERVNLLKKINTGDE